jgi:hypothetical protein
MINEKRYYVDYYIKDLNLIIEYNGDQHYCPVQFGGISIEKAKEKLEKQKLRDQNLRAYCEENKINLLEINGIDYKGENLRLYLNNYFLTNNWMI